MVNSTPNSKLLCANNLGLFLLLCLLKTTFSFAQEDFKPKMGQIDRASLEMTAYPGDSSADAVVLYDYADVGFVYDDRQGFMLVMEYWARIKILRESALDRASVALSYGTGATVDQRERIEGIRGYSYNLEDNQIVTRELDKKSIREEKISEDYRGIKFNLPNVKKGSVIEYSYRRRTPLSVKNEPDTWFFQGSIPYKWSEYKIQIPAYLEYKITMGGYMPLHIHKTEQTRVDVGFTNYNGNGMAYRFVVKDAPAFRDEPFITTSKDYLSKIKFELASVSIPGQMTKKFSQTWEQVDRTLDQATWFGGELRKSGYLKDAKAEILGKTKDPSAKMQLAYDFVRKRIKWNGYNGLGSEDGVRKAFDNGKGNVSDINITLVNLLRELELEANPMILSTRSHGRIIQEIPMLESFNYLVAHVKIADVEYWLDATQPYAKAGMLPEEALNTYARLLPKKGEGRFIDLNPKDIRSQLQIVNGTINPQDGTIKGNYTVSYGGYNALAWRNKYVDAEESAITNDFKKEMPEWALQNIVVKNKSEDLNLSVQMGCDFEVEDESMQPNMFYFNPLLLGRWATNPLKSQERIYPLDFASGLSQTFIGTYTLPDGYAIEEIPANEILSLPEKGGRFSYQISQEGNQIQLKSAINLSKLSYTSEEYHLVKEFFERVVQKQAKPLVIKKK